MGRMTFVAIFAAAVASIGCDRKEPAPHPDPIDAKPIAHHPKKLDPSCREGAAKVYDECSEQSEVFSAALEEAKNVDKPLLVVYGAEWCIWCHVFEKYIEGEYGRYDYAFEHTSGPLELSLQEQVEETTRNDAAALNQFVAENFVVVYIEGQYAPGGEEVIASTGVDTEPLNYFPVIMSVGNDGKVGKVMDSYTSVPNLEIRESGGQDYRGFDRKVLLSQLRELYKAAN